MNQDLTTLICLFHDRTQAQAACNEILAANVPPDTVTLFGRDQPGGTAALGKLNEFDLPRADLRHVLDSLEEGGVVLAVSSLTHLAGKVEAIFGAHQASLVAQNERPSTAWRSNAEVVAADDHAVIPVIREELQVGKRTVDSGGVRIYRRVVEVPVDEQVGLQDQHVAVDRNPVRRAATEQERGLAGEYTVELTETREDLVVSKAANVIEEVIVGRESSERSQRVRETVRHTEIEVEQIAPASGQDPNLTAGRGGAE